MSKELINNVKFEIVKQIRIEVSRFTDQKLISRFWESDRNNKAGCGSRLVLGELAREIISRDLEIGANADYIKSLI